MVKQRIRILYLISVLLLIGTVLAQPTHAEEVEITETIQMDLSGAVVVLSQSEYSYDGKPKQPNITVTLDGQLLTEGLDYSVQYQDNTFAGTGKAVVTGEGDYTGQVECRFSITCSTPKLKAIANSVGGVKVTWNKTPGAVSYCVFRRTGNGKWVRLGITKQLSYLDKTAKSGVKYTYTVRCVNQSSSQYVSDYSISGLSVSYVAAPHISKTENLNGGIRLTWDKVKGAVRYRVFRKSGTSWKKLSDVTGITYTDQNVKSGVKYTYTVRSISANGKSFTSSYDSKGTTVQYFAPPKLSSAVNTQKGIAVRWNKVNGIKTYRVYRRAGNSGWKAVAKVTGTSWTGVPINLWYLQI